MRIRKVDFTYISPIGDKLTSISENVVVFIRPFGSKLFRVYSLPVEKTSEVFDILCDECTRHCGGIWYFLIRSEEEKAVIVDRLIDIDVENLFAEPDREINN